MAAKPFFERGALLGIGLIGSSLARVMRRDRLTGHIAVCARKPETLAKASELGLADSLTDDPLEAVENADLVVLGRDILTIDPMEIKDIPVLMTMTGGKFVYINPNRDPDQEVKYYRYPARTSYLN